MLERLVKPILDIYKEMEELQMESKEKDKVLEALKKEYDKKEERLETEQDKIHDKISNLGEKQLKLRKELGASMRKAKCAMTTTKIDGILYGICDTAIQ